MAMDLQNIIRGLLAEKNRLEAVIASLEALENAKVTVEDEGTLRKRRGRISMSQEERHKVSERMLNYWENHRQARVVERTLLSSTSDPTAAH
jgi:uncharacterized secreted protein with C-terminal beta-propeller domain